MAPEDRDRDEGYYWVKWDLPSLGWSIAYWTGNYWHTINCEEQFSSKNFEIISPMQINEPKEQEIVPGYSDAKESLLAKLEEPMEMYLLCKLKIAQFRAGQTKHPAIERELKENLMIHAREIDDVFLRDIES